MASHFVKKDDISIVLCGAAGQGIQTVEKLLTHLFKLNGYNLFSTKEYMSRVRGGSNSTELRVSSYKVKAFVDKIDILLPLNRDAFTHVRKRISSETIIIGEKDILSGENGDYEIINVPFSRIAKEIGGSIYTNIVAVGLITALFKIDSKVLTDFIGKRFKGKGEDVVHKNIQAAEIGYEQGTHLISSGTATIDIQKDPSVADDIIVSGGDAIGLGAIAGGCNFISSYPMTPSTSVLTFLAQNSKDFHIIVEQAEDEIAAMNMAIGSWYAGARGMVTTSGGGFALMVEGLSLSAMIESPIVVHLGQRPAPATGLPTRTEQGDLLFALFAGHGEFPRILFAPGTLEDAFYLTQKAFNMADKYQIPVFILTDQYFIDSYYNFPKLDVKNTKIERYTVKTDAHYQRYTLTESGVSPRGIPGFGDGLIVVDSDEHDYEGHITEDHDIRTSMVDKRLKKNESIIQNAIPPELVGNKDCGILVVCWGSTYNIVREALARLGRDDISMLHFKQVYPLHPDTPAYFDDADKVIIVENNALSQFSHVLKLYANIDITEKILKYNGLPFSVEELTGKLHHYIH
ncbi:MAG TPA: 2-oxoacid:acceptor oxidoreductase subunit alpha [Anaerolineae bacterium]|nr:2-oxoacid:acceptor oxidoreductase subunit alpha [Anaerolineae bacterium]